MDITGLGYSIIEKFINLGYLKNITDIYSLKDHKAELQAIEGFGEKSIENILLSIENSKKRPFDRVLFAIGIRHVGDRTAKILAKKFRNIKNIMNAAEEEILNIHEIGPKIANSVSNFFKITDNRKIIEKFIKAGLQFEISSDVSESDKLSAYTFVLTGTLDGMTREEAKSIIESMGGKVSTSVSSKTSFLLAGNDAGSKLDKAKKLGINIINEKDFQELIK
jgi:DNA ligase (NAD+)